MMSDTLLLVVITIVLYINSLECYFVFDDISAIVNNRDVKSNESSIWSLFDNDYWGTPIVSEHSHKSYRPLTVTTFRLNYLFNSFNPFGYHLVNVILHITVTLIYYNFCYDLLKKREPSLISALLFCTNPIKTEAVTGVVGRAELLSTLFFLLSMSSYANRKYFLFVIEVICAILSKEQGITVLAVVFIKELSDYIKRKQYHCWHSTGIKCILLVIFGSIIITMRIHIMGGKNSFPVFTKFDNPASFEWFPTRHLTFNYLLPLNAYLVLFPYNLCCDWTMKSIPLIYSIWDIRNLWTLLFYAVLVLLLNRCVMYLIRHRSDHLTLIMALIVFPFIPASNLFFSVGFVIAERTLYTPSAGLCLLISIGWQRLDKNLFCYYKKLRKLFVVLFCLTIFSFSLKTQSRNSDWKNELTLFTSAIKVNPRNAKLYNNIGHYYERLRLFDNAINYFRLASFNQRDDLGSDINIARTLINMGHTVEAEKMLWKIKSRVKLSIFNKRIVPSYLNLWINLANIIASNKTRLKEAEFLYRELIGMRSDFADAYINLGDILIRQSKLLEAIDIYRRGLLQSEAIKCADLYYNLGVAHSMLMKSNISIQNQIVSQHDQVLQIAFFFSNATHINPYHKEALVNLAILTQQNQNLLKMFRQPLITKMKRYPSAVDKEIIYFNLALLLSDEGDNVSAVLYLKEAIAIKHDFRGALFNLALIMVESQNFLEAEHYLKQLLTYHSNHTKSLLLLSSISANHLKNLNFSKKNYQNILKQTNVEAIQDLCVIYSQRNKTKEAEECFKRVKSIEMSRRSKH